MPFDEKLRPDLRAVLDAAALLDVTEWQLFQLAWLRWHGEAASDRQLEAHFVGYMFDERVPPWVRDFARLIARRHEAGRLDRYALGVARLPRSPRQATRGLRYAVLVFLVVGTLVVLAQGAAELLSLAERCVFPPCA